MKRLDPNAVIAYIGSHPGVNAGALAAVLGRPRSTINQILARLVEAGKLQRRGAGRATTYHLVARHDDSPAVTEPDRTAGPSPTTLVNRSARASALQASLGRPLGSRTPVTYQREFVDRYQPNNTFLLPEGLAQELFERGRLPGRLPAGTYARRVLEQLLIDLSWYSSRLEGNNKTLLDTRELFQRGRSPGDDADATMLLNHKEAIEFIVDAVPEYGIVVPVVRNIQAILMNDLLEATELGSTRAKLVDISDSVYLPTKVPQLIEEMLGSIVEKARAIRNPVESAFFLWVNIAYLQPFADGNKRTSRLSANLPLLISNCAPLSFIDVTQSDYANAMLGVYEERNPALAIELFEWTYRRSIERYQVIVAAMGAPDPLRSRYREQIGDAVRAIVHGRHPLAQALGDLALPAEDYDFVASAVSADLASLEVYNCARFRLPIGATERWIADGRPIS